MTILPIYGAPSKKELIQMAREKCGQDDYYQQITPQEYDGDLRRLNSLMYELQAQGIDLRYNQPTSNLGSPEDDSGIPYETQDAVTGLLAQRIAPLIGKALPPEFGAALARSMAVLRAKYAVVPSSVYRRDTPRGAGNGRWINRSAYYSGVVPSEE